MYTVPVPSSKINQQTRQQIGEAIYLLMYLIERCNWETGRLATTQESIAAETGIPLPTIKRWLQTLVEAGEIATRRIPNGTLFTILDYASIARTRMGGKAAAKHSDDAPRVSPAAPKRPVRGPKKVSRAVPESIISGPCKVSSVIPESINPDPSKVSPVSRPRITSGLNNINKTISKVIEPNLVQSNSFLSICSKAREALSLSGQSRETRPDIFDYTDPWEKRLTEVCSKLEAMEPEESNALIGQALKAMAADRRPFVRHFVKLGENGELTPSGTNGEEMVLRRVWEMLQASSG